MAGRRGGNDGERRRPTGDIDFEEVVSGVGDEVADLVERLPEDVDVIERDLAPGADPAELQQVLDGLPDEADIERLSEALDDPEELDRLLAERG